MAKTTNITRYVCDRCGKTAYVAPGDPSASDWREIKRVTADGVDISRLVCSTCNAEHKKLANNQDAAFNAFMASGKEA